MHSVECCIESGNPPLPDPRAGLALYFLLFSCGWGWLDIFFVEGRAKFHVFAASRLDDFHCFSFGLGFDPCKSASGFKTMSKIFFEAKNRHIIEFL